MSGPSPGTLGSLLEMSRGGAEPITLRNGEARAFLENGDEVALTAIARREGYRSIGFGSCVGTVSPAVAP